MIGIRQALDEYTRHLEGLGRSPSTLRGYPRDISQFIRFADVDLGEEPDVDLVDAGDVGRWKRVLIDEGKRPGTINRYLTSLKGFFDWALKQGYAEENPASEIKKSREEVLAPKSLDKITIRKIEKSIKKGRGSKAPQIRDMAIFSLLKNSGMRVGELCSLKWEDISYPKESSGALVIIRHGKGDKRRVCAVNSEGVVYLKKYKKIHSGRSETEIEKYDYIFPSNHKNGGVKKPLTPSTIREMLNRYCDSCNVARINPHALRHSFAKNLVDAGIPLTKIAKQLGHSSTSMVYRYSTPTDIDLSDMVEEIAWK